jgi:hypothetical protein
VNESFTVQLEVASEKESLSPVVMRTDSEKVKRADLDVDETGQPSPVSVLESPFHDESCTTPEYSLAGLSSPLIPLYCCTK